MQKSISYWAFPGGLEGVKDIAEAMLEAKQAGYGGIELTVSETGQLALDTPESRIKEIAAISKEIGLDLPSVASGLFWDYNFSNPDAANNRKAKEVVRKMLETASLLGADTILVIPGSVDVFFNPNAPVITYETVYEKTAAALHDLAPLAKEYGVSIGVENVWNKFLLSPLEMKRLIDDVASAYIGAYFDVGNSLLTGYPEHWIRILGKRIKKVHFKDFRKSVGTAEGFVDLLEGDVNWPEVMAALQEIGYDGYVTAEMIPLYRHFPEARIVNTSLAMDRIFSLVKGGKRNE